ncbi:hypothetical protein ANN_10966 [Periplaneta americana]|uniref:Uncharacterized protein n=1 Tax=Periplaneta americana TaxID=6978 RepID=A0ABQ8T3Q1_PERAM|nr:hypothetical protein ANN_10966 [Periplaneta americana]
MAQSVKALACQSEIAFRRGFDPRLADYLACALVTEKDILALPEPRKGKKLSEKTTKKVIDFYLDDDNSRIMPGMKDKMPDTDKHFCHEELRFSSMTILQFYLGLHPFWSMDASTLKFACAVN